MSARETTYPKVFPPHLMKGSRGGAVNALHDLLCKLGFSKGLVFDGEYGDTTAERVADLQREMLDVDPDGNFGPQTRQALLTTCRINADETPAHFFPEETGWTGPKHKGLVRWNPNRPNDVPDAYK